MLLIKSNSNELSNIDTKKYNNNKNNIYIDVGVNIIGKKISTSNYMFVRGIWDKLPKYIFENFEIA